MVEDPAGGGVAVRLAVGVDGLVGGVGTQQVVEGVPARGVLAIRRARVSSPSTRRASGMAVAARLAAAGTLMSGPGCKPSSRNIRAAASPSWR